MKYKRLICVAVLAGLCLPVFADVGDLKPVAVPYQYSRLSMPLRVFKPTDFTSRTEGDGTVNENAKIAKLSMAGGGTLLVAIDSTKAESKAPSVLRFDFTGQGKFDDKLVVPVKTWGKGYYQFGPATLDIPVGDKTIPVQVECQYRHERDWRYLGLTFGTALQGECAFGEKVLPIQLIDNTNNLRCLDPLQMSDGRNVGDMVFVGNAVNVLPQLRTNQGSFVGQYVQVDDQWYELHVSDDWKITASPVKVEMTKARIPYPWWNAFLLGKHFSIQRTGNAEPFEIPVDTYQFIQYQQRGAGKDARSQLMCYFSGGEGNPIPLKPGEVNELKVGSPLSIKIDTNEQGGRLRYFQLIPRDAAGMYIGNLLNAKGERPAPPEIEVFDESGKSVYKVTMEYG